MKLFTIIILLQAIFAITLAQPVADDLVEHFPGYGEYDFDVYSGMLKVAETRSLHYVLLESQSSPSTDPLVVWLNGGPGCSSLLGLIQENGPFIFTGINTKLSNNTENSWNKQANVLYIEGPAGVGFSTNTQKFYKHNDERTAADFLEALVQFRTRFADKLNFKNPLFLSGESYAGMYVPFFAKAILDYNEQQQEENQFKLKGFLIGNGAFQFKKLELAKSIMGYYVDNNFFSNEIKQLYEEGCKESIYSEKCQQFMQPYSNVMNNTDRYAIYNYTYSYGRSPLPASTQSEFLMNKILEGLPENFVNMFRYVKEQGGESNNSVPDPMEIIKQYFNLEEVQTALHVPKRKWQECNFAINLSYGAAKNSTYLYPEFLEKGLDIMIFSGNTDAMISTRYTADNLEDLFTNYQTGLQEDQKWKQWSIGDQVAGMVQYWKTAQGNKFAHVMVRDAGHEVPMYKPEAAYKMFSNFIAGNYIY